MTEHDLASIAPPSSSQEEAIFLTDPSAEAERIAQLLRQKSYHVVDVPLSLLVARVAVQRPSVVLLDIDAEGADEVVLRLAGASFGPEVAFVFIGEEARRSGREGLFRHARAFFARPVDGAAALASIAAIVPPPNPDRPSHIPPSLRGRQSQQPETVRPSPRPPPPSRPPVPTAPPSQGPPNLDQPADEAAVVSTPSPPGATAQLSPDLARILGLAEERVARAHAALPRSVSDRLDAGPLGVPRTSEDDSVDLPPEVLAALEEPIDFDSEAGSEPSDVWNASTPGRGTPAGTSGGTENGKTPGPPTKTGAATGVDATPPAPPVALHIQPDDETPRPPPRGDAAAAEPVAVEDEEPETPRPPRRPPPSEPPPSPRVFARAQAELRPSADNAPVTQARPPMALDRGDRPYERTPDPPRAELVPVIAAPAEPRESAALHPGASVRLLGEATSERHTGTLCFDDGLALRRVVFRDGDPVTAASSADGETLLAFLVDRGDLPRDVGARLAGRVAPFGRHAGAALIAHGHLAQDRLWEVLRSHAEAVLARCIVLSAGTCAYEVEAPGRLRAEPSVFGGSAGAEVLVEIVRRAIPATDALEQLGGAQARLTDGKRKELIGECALAAREQAALGRAAGATLGEVIEDAGGGDFASVLLALANLRVVEVLAASEIAAPVMARALDPLDAEAFRERVRARLELVEEGDYFAVLGVAPHATPYEIKRAYLDLRRSFEPARALTGATADLAPRVAVILEVLDEAYEILRDDVRRDRYRRALLGVPPRLGLAGRTHSRGIG